LLSRRKTIMSSKKKTGTIKRKTTRRRIKETRAVSEFGLGIPEPALTDAMSEIEGVETTGRFIVIFKDEAAADVATVRSTLSNVAGVREMAASVDYEGGAVSAEDLAETEVVYFQSLGIAVVSGENAVQQLAATTAADDSPILAIEPEYIARLSNPPDGGLAVDYLRGYKDAVNHLYDQLIGSGVAPGEEAEVQAIFQDSSQFTWGLQATGVSTSRHSGQGIRVAVLDTGMDLQHPDFLGRAIETRSFVSGVTVQDIHGHGTHCIGTACGPERPSSGVRRYGVAFGAQIFVGKVFNNDSPPGAPTSSVIAGIEWAVNNGCRVASLSLGARINQKILQYEVPVQRALNAGTLVVAAAGNNASRPLNPGFVEPPANADAALAVAAVDNQLRIASFSARSSQATGDGGKVNIAGPGVAVFSSVPLSRGRHAIFNGTSMATPHVAGIAALWAQSAGLSGSALWSRLVQSIRPLNIPSLDVGAGLVQAPQ
jgi:subtilisin family serine protease